MAWVISPPTRALSVCVCVCVCVCGHTLVALTRNAHSFHNGVKYVHRGPRTKEAFLKTVKRALRPDQADGQEDEQEEADDDEEEEEQLETGYQLKEEYRKEDERKARQYKETGIDPDEYDADHPVQLDLEEVEEEEPLEDDEL